MSFVISSMDSGVHENGPLPISSRPHSLKFTAIRVRLASLTSRRKHQVVVISNETTALDLIEMVVKKTRMNRNQVPLIRLVAHLYGHAKNAHRDHLGVEQYVLTEDDKPLVLYDSLPKGSIQFSLAWAESNKTDDLIPIQADRVFSPAPPAMVDILTPTKRREYQIPATVTPRTPGRNMKIPGMLSIKRGYFLHTDSQIECVKQESAKILAPLEAQIKETPPADALSGEVKMADTAERLRESLEKSIMRYNNWSPADNPDNNYSSISRNNRVNSEEFLVHYEPCQSDVSSLPTLSPRRDHVDFNEWNSLDQLANLPGYNAPNRRRPVSHHSDTIVEKQKRPVRNVERRQNSLDSSKLEPSRYNSSFSTSSVASFSETGSASSGIHFHSVQSDSNVVGTTSMSVDQETSMSSRLHTPGGSSIEEYCLNLDDGDAGYLSYDGCTSSRYDNNYEARYDVTRTSSHEHVNSHSKLSMHVDKSSTLSSSLPNMLDINSKKLRCVPFTSSTIASDANSDPQTKRSLPKLELSNEKVEQKRKSISEQFSKKMQQYKSTSGSVPEPPRPEVTDDDTMSVTSLEVADILCGAGPLAPSSDDEEYEEEVIEADTYHSSDEDTDTGTLDGESPTNDLDTVPPLVRPGPPAIADTLAQPTARPVPEKSPPSGTSEVKQQKAARLSHFVEQSMASFLTNLTISPSSSQTEESLNGRHFLPSISTTPTQKPSRDPSHDPPDDFPRDLKTSTNILDQKPVSVFDLLQNFKLSWVTLVRSIECENSGLSLKDMLVTVRCSSADKTCVLPCVVEWAPPSDGVQSTGRLQKGDLIVEINGKSAINQAAQNMTILIEQTILVEIVVARKPGRSIHKSTSTAPPTASF